MRREVMSILLSEAWVHQEPESLEHLAEYLYAFYHFLHLSDPEANGIGWSIAFDPDNGRHYLTVWESWDDQDDSSEEEIPEEPEIEPLPKDKEAELLTGEESGGGFTEKDLAPELRNQR